VNQYSMQKTLYEGDILWVEKITPLLGTLHRGDIITIYAPEVKFENFILVKRVVAVANDYIEIKDGKVFVNGAALDEKYIKGDYTQPHPKQEIMPLKLHLARFTHWVTTVLRPLLTPGYGAY